MAKKTTPTRKTGKSTSWALAPAPESKDHARIKPEYGLFIGGKWVKPKSGTRSTGSGEPYYDTINPANEHLPNEPALHVSYTQHRGI